MVFASIFFWFCVFGGAGCGTRASRPLGVSGVITMKIISRTRRMSISGTTFIEAIAPFFAPTSIPIFVTPLVLPCLRFPGPPFDRGPVSAQPVLGGRRRRRAVLLLYLVG